MACCIKGLQDLPAFPLLSLPPELPPSWGVPVQLCLPAFQGFYAEQQSVGSGRPEGKPKQGESWYLRFVFPAALQGPRSGPHPPALPSTCPWWMSRSPLQAQAQARPHTSVGISSPASCGGGGLSFTPRGSPPASVLVPLLSLCFKERISSPQLLIKITQ